VIALIHFAVTVYVHPPAPANIARVTWPEISLESNDVTFIVQNREELLERALLRYRIGCDNGVIIEPLAPNVDNWAIASPTFAATGGKGCRNGNRQTQYDHEHY
jgi:hypothetical protein